MKLEQIDDENNIPKHVAIIMDGNRRWAKAHNLPTAMGHKKGAEVLEEMISFSNKIGIQYLTVYAFSTENWKRSKEEVGALMSLLEAYLDKFSKRADDENIKIIMLGEKEGLSEALINSINKAIERTKNNTGMIFNMAFNYGGRAEIIRGIKQISEKVKNNELAIENIDEQIVSDFLYTKNQPDPDLLIRTSGEQRISNFLPWQLVYSEFVFMDKYWPDFIGDDLLEAINIYQKRNRKFGAK